MHQALVWDTGAQPLGLDKARNADCIHHDDGDSCLQTHEHDLPIHSAVVIPENS